MIGGAFAQSSATWRWGFYINLPIAAVFAPIMLLFIPSFGRNAGVSFIGKVKKIDFLGVILSTAALASGTMAISFGGVLFGWNDRRIIAMFVLSGVLLIAFFVTQHLALFTTTAQRIFPMDFWQDRNLVLLGVISGECRSFDLGDSRTDINFSNSAWRRRDLLPNLLPCRFLLS